MYNNVLHWRYSLANYDPTAVDYKAEKPAMLLFDIGSSPFDSADAWWNHDLFGFTARPLAQYLSSGEPNRSLNDIKSDKAKAFWRSLQYKNSQIGTHLNPLGERTVAELILQAYALTIAQLHVFYTSPLIHPPPTVEDFLSIARGELRGKKRQLWIMHQGSHYVKER